MALIIFWHNKSTCKFRHPLLHLQYCCTYTMTLKVLLHLHYWTYSIAALILLHLQYCCAYTIALTVSLPLHYLSFAVLLLLHYTIIALTVALDSNCMRVDTQFLHRKTLFELRLFYRHKRDLWRKRVWIVYIKTTQ